MTEPWEQQEKESSLWFARFQQYLLAPGKRSLLECCNKERELKGKKRTKNVSGAWGRAYTEFRWKERAEAWDKNQRVIELDKWRQRKEEWREKEWLAAQKLLEKSQQMLQYPLVSMVAEDGVTRIEPARWSFRDAAAYLEVAGNLVRGATGESKIDELEAVQRLIDAGWIPHHVLEEASKGMKVLKESVQRAFGNNS